MGMIKIKNERFKDSGFSEYELLPVNPYSKFRTIRIKFYGKEMLHSFDTQKEADEIMKHLQQRLQGFVKIADNKWIRASSIKRYKVYPDVFKISIICGQKDHTIKIDDPDMFDTMVEYLDKSL